MVLDITLYSYIFHFHSKRASSIGQLEVHRIHIGLERSIGRPRFGIQNISYTFDLGFLSFYDRPIYDAHYTLLLTLVYLELTLMPMLLQVMPSILL